MTRITCSTAVKLKLYHLIVAPGEKEILLTWSHSTGFIRLFLFMIISPGALLTIDARSMHFVSLCIIEHTKQIAIAGLLRMSGRLRIAARDRVLAKVYQYAVNR